MTENCATCTNLNPYQPLGRVGKAAAEVEIKIDPNNSEILMKGPFLMKGYYKLPELTKETIKDGWLHTGDQGVIDKDGFLFVTGRVKDLFKTTKGKYIEPLVLESHFTDISEFEQICIVGLGLDQPICLGVLSEIGKEKTKEEIKGLMTTHLDKINSKLLGYQKISTFVVVKNPWTVENGLTTPTMKIKRNQIDKIYDSNFSKWHNDQEKVIFES
jgi:long-subunit acyl-CoA synthetase (AMP-forming)